VVLTCSDSRVSPEFYFDQGLGDLFVVRGAGNTLNDHVIGSIEYAVEHLQASVIVVVGHEKCGAVAAAVAGGRAEGRIGTILAAIMPAVRESRNQAGDKTDNAARSNARLVVKTLPVTSPLISSAVQSGQIKIFAARYDLASGRIELLP
jgi:carbonic anhydrase